MPLPGDLTWMDSTGTLEDLAGDLLVRLIPLIRGLLGLEGVPKAFGEGLLVYGEEISLFFPDLVGVVTGLRDLLAGDVDALLGLRPVLLVSLTGEVAEV